MKTSPKTIKRQVRRNRIRSRVSGTATKPRLAVFKSNRYIYAEVIDDTVGKTVVHVTSMKMSGKTKAEQARAVGSEVAKLATSKKIKEVVFDRGGYIYTGRVKALADAAREEGLVF